MRFKSSYIFLFIVSFLFAFNSKAEKDMDSLSVDQRWKIIDTFATGEFEGLLKFTFYAPDSTPARSNIKIFLTTAWFDSSRSSYVTSIDSIVPTYIDSSGTYSAYVTPDFYALSFAHSVWGEICTFPIGISIQSHKGMHIEVHFTNGPRNCIRESRVDKPVIYLYPDRKTDVEITLQVNGQLGLTYPPYENGWKVTANPNGELEVNGKTYTYLFWDAVTQNALVREWNSGFIVSRDSLVSFLEKQLTFMNLTSKEQQDFITYWVPRMIKNEKNYIHFSFNDANNQVANLQITPVPAHVFRVYMIWMNWQRSDNEAITPQQLEKCNRNGFTVIEWGGSEFAIGED